MLSACKIIDVSKIDPGTCHSRVERGWNSEKDTINTGKNQNLWVSEFETNFITKNNSIDCCKLVKELALWKSIRNLTVQGLKGAEIANDKRLLPKKKSQLMSLWIREKFYNGNKFNRLL